jgi:hypothetical protein
MITLAINNVPVVFTKFFSQEDSVRFVEDRKFAQATLAKLLEQPGIRVAVQRKTTGPIAAIHGVQYSLAAVDKTLNLQTLLPKEFVSSPKEGIISNTTFLLHVSEAVWADTVLPALECIGCGVQQVK